MQEKNIKNDFEKYFCKLMDRSVFGKTMKNERKYRDVKLVTVAKRTMYFVSETIDHTIFLQEKLFTGNELVIETNKHR